MKRFLIILTLLLVGSATWAQKPGSTPVKVSHEKQMLHGRKYYVHIVEKGQTVYSIAKAYKVQSYDAVTHVDIHSLHPGDTVWLPFRGQFSDSEEQATQTPVTTPAPTATPVDTVHVHDTAYIYIHDTTYIDAPYAVHDTTYIKVPYAVHDTTIITDTVTLTKYVTVHDTAYIDAPYAVHDTTFVTDTVTLTKYVTVHDTAYINAPYAVHDTTIVTDTVTLTKYITVHDTTHIDAPYAVHDTTFVTDTVTLTKFVTVHDTTYITVHDTNHIDVPYTVHDTTIVTNTVTLTEYVQVHDTTIVTDTVTLTKYVSVHDTTYVDAPYTVYDTTVITDTVRLTEYMTVHDTAFIAVHDTININVPYTVHDTTFVTDTVRLTEYVQVHDTTFITLHDTTNINVPYTVHDTTFVTDTVRLTEYVQVHDTTYITVHDTTHIDVPYAVHDTTYIAVHDTTFVIDTVELALAPTPDIALASSSDLASASAVALTEYMPDMRPPSPTTALPQQVGKTLKVTLMMPLHLNEIDEISTTKFDVEQRGKKNYRQFEFIEFYEGILMALEQMSSMGINARVELNVVDVTDNSAEGVQRAFQTHNVAQSDVVIALLFRDAFAKAAELSREAGVYIVNPMSTRSEICADNPYLVKIQPSMESQVKAMLDNMKAERPDGHLYIIHGGNAEKPVLNELKRQLNERGDIKYTLFNWSQSNKLTSTLKATPNCNVLSIYDQKADQMRVYVSNLLNRLSAIKSNSPTLYTLSDWTRDYTDIDFSQLQLLNYHTFSSNWDLSNNVHVDFLTHFRDRFGSEPTSALAATGYDLTLYIVNGLSLYSNNFWTNPGASLPSLIHPIRLGRRQAGLENNQPQLYRMESLHFVPATTNH